MGNSEVSWKAFYNLRGLRRDGQEAVDDMRLWRESMAAICVTSGAVAAEELADVVIVTDDEGTVYDSCEE